MKVEEMVEYRLRRNHSDGLWRRDCPGCSLDDGLFCEEFSPECEEATAETIGGGPAIGMQPVVDDDPLEER